jgi:hypothetical protein
MKLQPPACLRAWVLSEARDTAASMRDSQLTVTLCQEDLWCIDNYNKRFLGAFSLAREAC